MYKKFLIILLGLSDIILCQQDKKYPFQDPNLTIEERVSDLVSRMTLEEKVSQMVYNAPAIERLGIPEYNWWNEGLHGVARNGLATVFPQAIGLAAMWDTDLIYKTASVISDEARAKFNKAFQKGKTDIYQGLTFWSPNINIFRDPRWGRGMETYGEDPFLTGTLGIAFVKGLQGNNEKYLKAIATPKHFAVHSGPEPERHRFDLKVSEYDLRETYLPAFKDCIVEGSAFSVMCAYNRLRGKACCGSDLLLNDILRNEWNFKGYVVSDCWALHDFYREDGHLLVKTAEEAAALGLISGTDLNCGMTYPKLANSVNQNLVSEALIDTAVKRLFTARFKLGMFDPPEMVPYSKISYDVVNSVENQKLALETARKSIVLLKNDGLLPLSKELKQIAVIGPNAVDEEVLLGNYNGTPLKSVTIFQGIKEKLGDKTKVIYSQGCELAKNFPAFYTIPEEYLFLSPEGTENGLNAEYFNNNEFKEPPAFKRVDRNIDFKWLESGPREDFDPNNFGVRWTGYLIPPKDGKYFIGGWGFNGFRIYFEDSLIVTFDANHHPRKVSKELELKKGTAYKIKVVFFERSRYAEMRLLWAMPADSMEEEALSLVKNSDAVILCLGLSPGLEGEEMDVPIEGFYGGDRLDSELPQTQSNFIKKVYALGKPVILVILSGSALSIHWEKENIPAILEAWYPGQAGGTAAADIIFGDYNPSGKLPVTFYKTLSRFPPIDNYNMKGRTYRYYKGEPLFSFGYGLSYSKFQVGNLMLDKGSITIGDSVNVKVEVTNTGKYDGEEVIQLYIRNDKQPGLNPVKTLKGFTRVSLKPDERKTVSLLITPESLFYYNENAGDFVLDPGEYKILVGSSSRSEDLNEVILKVTRE